MRLNTEYRSPFKAVLFKAMLLLVIPALFLSGCSVVSKDIRRDAAPDVTFESLKPDAAPYEGETVILGGYILETGNLADQTRVLVLQTPLGMRDEPKARDRSRGRFVVVYDGFLDPEVYERGRRITVAGEVMGTEPTRINGHEYPLPVIRPLEVHLWREYDQRGRYYYHDPFHPWPDPHFRFRPYPYYYW